MWIFKENHNSGSCVWQVAPLTSYFVQMDLQMAFSFIKSKAEKYLRYFKLISIASGSRIIKVQATNSFNIASIESAYLNNYGYIFLTLHVNHGQWLTCLRSGTPPINQCCPFKTAPQAPTEDVPFSKLSFSSRWIFPESIYHGSITTIHTSLLQFKDYRASICQITR